MSATVTLTVLHGSLKGKEFTFEDPEVLIVGRSRDCDLSLPNVEANALVSRHHCMLNIDPPSVRIRDLDSMNGTYVSGELIGMRETGRKAGGVPTLLWPARELHDGDEIQVGTNVFRVAIHVPVEEGMVPLDPEDVFGMKKAEDPSAHEVAECY
jgi:serine/threonine-protein kinase